MAITYKSHGVDPPQPTATNFKGNGGTHMVWDYLASCYCFQYQVPFTVSQQRYPKDGCYLGAPIDINYQITKQSCNIPNKGYLSIVQSAEKTSFLTSIMPPGSTFDDTCPPQGGAYALCSTTVLYILDITTDLQGHEIDDELDWIRYHIIPGTAWGTSQQLGLISYGTGMTSLYPTGNRTEACAQLNYIQGNYEDNGSGDTTLLTTIETVDVLYHTISNMILFSASKDLNDITATGNYIKANMASKHFTVIALNGADFTNFPATVYNVDSFADPPPNLGSCIIKNACSQGDDCDITGATDAPVYFPTTTTPSTTTTTSTTSTPKIICRRIQWIFRITPSRRSAPGVLMFSSHPGDPLDMAISLPFSPFPPDTTTVTISTTPVPENKLACQCNYSQVWLDVMFVFDASSATGPDDLVTLWNIVQPMFDSLNIQKFGYVESNFTTRVGIITYGNTAYLYKSFGSVTNEDLKNISLPYNNDDRTNLNDALKMAKDQIGDRSRHAKKVIVILATTYYSMDEHTPDEEARDFKEYGILMGFNYLPEDGVAAPILKDLASPGYFFSSGRPEGQNNTYVDLLNAFCDANCFCMRGVPYTVSDRQYPIEGCYEANPVTSNYQRASIKCSMFNSGFLAIDESPEKSAFLASRLPNYPIFFIGLSYNSSDSQWSWQDGSPLGSYAPWQSGSVIDGSKGATCVYVDSKQQWIPTDCRNGYAYVCQEYPCDSMHYCTV